MASENCFILLGKTGVGKSTFAKILSENPNIKIGKKLDSETKESNSYECIIDDFKYSLIDTPGYDDSYGNDTKNYANIQNFLTSTNHNIKGIVLIFSFQDSRFGESHRKGLIKLAKLIPLDNFWNYVTIIFTKTFWDDPDEIEEIKEERLKDFKEIFDTLISAFNKELSIKKVDFSEINTIFVNLKEKKTKKKDLKKITDIFKKNSELEPLFHRLKIEEKWDEICILNKDNQDIGDLYKVKYKVLNYLNQKGINIKTIYNPIDKKFIKKIKKQSNLLKFEIFSFEAVGSIFKLGTFNSMLSSIFSKLIPQLPELFYYFSEYLSNKEFDEKKVIEELKIEEEF